MSEYLQIRSNGQITLPAPTRRKAKLKEGDLLEVLVEDDGSNSFGSQVAGGSCSGRKVSTCRH